MADHVKQSHEQWTTPEPGARRTPEADSLSEEQIHREHTAALAATLFHDPSSHDEVVLELDSGLLRLLRVGR